MLNQPTRGQFVHGFFIARAIDSVGSKHRYNRDRQTVIAKSNTMDESQDINHILVDWKFDPFKINVRKIALADREVLQMRIDLGILQLETVDRPDGQRPGDFSTYYHFMRNESLTRGEDFVFNEEQCLQIDREFVQFYNRRVCWLQLKEFAKAVRDADHTLALMDLCEVHSPDESWTVSHEQYRPFVIYHRTQAAALDKLEIDSFEEESKKPQNAERAIEEINSGLEQLRIIFQKYDAVENFEEDELVTRLTDFRESLRNRYDVGRTLEEQLNDAVSNEQYERAAEIRDRIRRRGKS